MPGSGYSSFSVLCSWATARATGNVVPEMAGPILYPPGVGFSSISNSKTNKHISRTATAIKHRRFISMKEVTMSETQQGDWTKPAAMAIPEGGFFKDQVEQGRYGPIFPKTRLATASPSSRRSSPDESRSSTSTPRTSRMLWLVSLTSLPCSSCITCDGTLFDINGETYFQHGHFRY